MRREVQYKAASRAGRVSRGVPAGLYWANTITSSLSVQLPYIKAPCLNAGESSSNAVNGVLERLGVVADLLFHHLCAGMFVQRAA